MTPGGFVRGLVDNLMLLIGFAGLTMSPPNVNAQTNAGKSSIDGGCGLAQNAASRSEESCYDVALSNGFAMPATVPSQPFPREYQLIPEQMKLASGYRVTREFSLPGDAAWNHIVIDRNTRREYVSHGDEIQVLSADSGRLLGQIPAPGAHGVALAPDLQRGFTSNGKDKSVTVFDTKTLAVIKSVKLEGGTTAVLYDPFTKRVFAINQKTTALEAQTGEVAGTVDLGGDPEAAVSDGKGTVYVNLADKMAVAVVDPKSLTVTKTFPIDYCTSPHSLSVDGATQRLFVGCREGFVVLDALTGKSVATSPMCSGVYASTFDSESKLVFEFCSEGVISVIRQMTPDNYRVIAAIPTQLWAATMVFDPKAKTINSPTGDFEFIPDADPTKLPQRRRKAGSFTVLVVNTKK
jgi:DNA-binding beta-propeller fold protein YncE